MRDALAQGNARLRRSPTLPVGWLSYRQVGATTQERPQSDWTGPPVLAVA